MTAHPANGPMAMDSALDLDELKRQQAALQRGGRLSRLHVAIVAASVVVTVLAWYTSSTLIEQRAEQRFEREIGRVIELVEERMHHYEDALLAGVASIQSNEGVVSRERDALRGYVVRYEAEYVGVGGGGVRLEAALFGGVSPPDAVGLWCPCGGWWTEWGWWRTARAPCGCDVRVFARGRRTRLSTNARPFCLL